MRAGRILALLTVLLWLSAASALSARGKGSSRGYSTRSFTPRPYSSRSYGYSPPKIPSYGSPKSYKSYGSGRVKCVTCERDLSGRIKRDPSAYREFRNSNPCTSTGKASGACPGYEVDHRTPLYKGGADRPYALAPSAETNS